MSRLSDRTARRTASVRRRVKLAAGVRGRARLTVFRSSQHIYAQLIDDAKGVWHLSNRTPVSWAEFARQVADALKLDTSLVRPTHSRRLGWTAPRPAYAALGSERGRMMPDLASALHSYALAMAHDPEDADPAACVAGFAADARVA